MLIPAEKIKDYFIGKVDGVLHIGGHHGEEQSFYDEIGAKHVTYFEPHPKNFEVISKKLSEREDVTLVNTALGDEDNIKKRMYCETSNQGQSNSLLKPALHETYYPGIQFNDAPVSVDQKKLDTYLSETSDTTTYNLLNIDVQGYEYHVFQGAVETLKNVEWIITEVNFQEMYEGGKLFDDLHDFLTKQGFKLEGVVPIHNGINEPIWGDAFYIRG